MCFLPKFLCLCCRVSITRNIIKIFILFPRRKFRPYFSRKLEGQNVYQLQRDGSAPWNGIRGDKYVAPFLSTKNTPSLFPPKKPY
uniref:Putative ovule protein n=1 Tax=Solanum chacoense TaxID=4108 RepID=A0A0V0HM33_SOLCH